MNQTIFQMMNQVVLNNFQFSDDNSKMNSKLKKKNSISL